MAQLSSLKPEGFRIPTPFESLDKTYVFRGWTAFKFVSGSDKMEERRWSELLKASRAFHESLAHVPQPDSLSQRSHLWAKADRVAWGGASIGIFPPLQQVYQDLVNLREHVNATDQAIHSDLTGNVLFDESLPPAIIDFSPYWRPPEYADGIIVADGLLDYGQSRELIRLNRSSRLRLQMVLRALIFRLVSESELTAVRGMSETRTSRYERALEMIRDELAGNEY